MNTIIVTKKSFELADALEQEGLAEIAEEIRTSIYSCATGLEIAFRLKDKLIFLRKGKKYPFIYWGKSLK